mmetsp:Transcript_37223/g.86976  ORF Transcript_37223/g.86976 Transcript_37223/m.86976 type:complete len:120 (-) Transcript_37223:474-833(-)|eukprot:CAMPEP_0119371022 /NCGR_PEP_ID=MMETSP1334-20130426/17292_1 /TAXON_ID=127549 /ORGANISM="Calcidiscus leptoporus, Strain RCC1130" /LENGTH=119 /DNA_ID=CAMNT_0007388217 /DNA_START=79 /DNA_END=438 /DNA_ORIENTATION=+
MLTGRAAMFLWLLAGCAAVGAYSMPPATPTPSHAKRTAPRPPTCAMPPAEGLPARPLLDSYALFSQTSSRRARAPAFDAWLPLQAIASRVARLRDAEKLQVSIGGLEPRSVINGVSLPA